MAKKGKSLSDLGGLVFSTNPNFNIQNSDSDIENTDDNKSYNLRIWLEKIKGGKVTSIIKGFEGSESTLKNLAKELKSVCGSGGSAKNNEIIIQGDHREKILNYLTENGFKAKKAGG